MSVCVARCITINETLSPRTTMLLLSLLLLVGAIAAQAQTCTLTQSRWRQSCALQSADLDSVCQLCGLGSAELLDSDATRQLQPQNTLWLLAAHQYCAATLNVWADPPCDTLSSGVEAALLLLGDSLLYVCSNMSQWTLQPALADALSLLLLFNQGQQPGCETCV